MKIVTVSLQVSPGDVNDDVYVEDERLAEEVAYALVEVGFNETSIGVMVDEA